ncbi:MAG: 50S ribosomal protein L33 [Candidatus Berkelbacteria bacterium]|nr:MAG: 50S ribosomal protein L33 [Candidatus Berkelbacteria bacterium]QQG51472.1 MAG: 50S ribosomal protein L33 [Candidatus Berkelbacteria bacterium]
MAKKKAARTIIHLECTECHEINYHTEKNKTKTPDRLQLKKLCTRCGKVTLHKEGK